MTKKITSLLLSVLMLAAIAAVPAYAADKPVVGNITVYAAKNASKVIDLTAAVESEKAGATYSIAKQPANGTFVRNDPAVQGVYKYTPNTGYTGTDTVQFTVTVAGVASSPATVTINVVEPGPIARNSTLDAVRGKAVKGVVDAEEPSDLDLRFEIVTEPTKGSVSVPVATSAADGNNPVGSFTYTANAEATGTDSFTYMAINASGVESAVATVSITFVAGNPKAQSATLHVIRNIAKLGEVHASDPVYAESDLTFEVVVPPLHGTLEMDNTPGELPEATDFINEGTFYYVPDKDYVGTDSFTFRAQNPDGLKSDVATISVVVGASRPYAESFGIEATRNGSADGKLKGTDPAAGAIRYTIEENPKRGTITKFDSVTGDFTYVPKKDRLGADSFKYSVSNGTEKSDIATVTVDIVPETYTPLEYADMKNGHWAHEGVGILGAMKMIRGEEIQGMLYFRPDVRMTRADFVMFLNAVMEIAPEAEGGESLFADITEPWLIRILNAAKKAGVTAGSVVNGATRFNPGGTLSRVEAVVFISNVLELPNVTTELKYTDRDQIPAWAVQHMKNMSAYEILSGYTDGTFRPNEPVTRAEAAIMLLKTYRERLIQLSNAADEADGLSPQQYLLPHTARYGADSGAGIMPEGRSRLNRATDGDMSHLK